MRPARLGRKASRRSSRGSGGIGRSGRLLVQGGLASVLAVAGLVAFATEASAHNNLFESVTATCDAPGSGAGATLTWTMYNNWNLSETGTLSTTQGALSTTALSMGASPTENAVPPAAASQTFTQDLTAAGLAALRPTTPISVGWSATWTDGRHLTGTLSTSLAELHLPNGCLPVEPTITTTVAPPSSTTVGNSWGDTATVTGDAAGGAPAGSVSFSVCSVASGSTSCTSGGTLVGTVTSPSSTSGDVSTYDLATTYKPASAGTFCFYSTYTPASTDNYTTASGPAECFTVTAVSTAAATVTPTTVGTAAATTPTPTTPPTTAASTPRALAFTGAHLSQQLMVGFGALLLGTALMFVARRRRRTPRHAAN
jgi:hypothetical protein